MVRLLAVAASAILCKNGGASRAPTAHISVPVGFDGPGEQDSLVEVNASLGQPYLGTSVTRSTNLRDQLNPTLLASLRNIGLSDAQISGMLQQGLLATDVTPSADEGTAVMDPTDYTEAEEALDRCRASNTRRLVKVAAITPLMLVATELVFFHGVGMELVASTFDAVARETAIPIANALSSFGSSIFTTATISIAGLEGSLFFTTLALGVVMLTMVGLCWGNEGDTTGVDGFDFSGCGGSLIFSFKAGFGVLVGDFTLDFRGLLALTGTGATGNSSSAEKSVSKSELPTSLSLITG